MRPENRILHCSRRAVLAGFLLCAGVSSVFSGGPGTGTADFLNIVPDPRIASLGGGGAGEIAEYPASAFNNPASLLGIAQPVLTLSYLSYPGEMHYSYSAFALPLSYGIIGAQLGVMTYGGMTGYDINFNPLQIEDSYGYLAALSYAFPIKTTVPVYKEFGAVGMTAKFVGDKLSNYPAQSVAVDAGAVFNLPFVPGLSAGAAYRNLGPEMKFVTDSIPLAQTAQYGLAYRNASLSHLIVAADFTLPERGAPAQSLGVSISPLYFLTLRGGYRHSDDSLFSDLRAGVGLEVGGFSLDYTLTQAKYFNDAHNISVTIALGNFIKIETASDYYLDKHLREACESYYRKDYIAARQQFEEILSAYPNHGPSQRYLDKTMAAINKLEEEKARAIAAYLTKADNAFEKKDFVMAKTYYSKVLDFTPDPEQTEHARAGLEKTWGMLDQVRQEKERQKNRGAIVSLWNKAHRDYVNGDYIKSKFEFEELLAVDPTNEEAQKLLTEVNNSLSKIASDQVDDLYLKASDLYKQGRYKEAKKYFNAVYLASPQRLDARDFAEKCDENLRDIAGRQQAAQLSKEQDKMRGEMDGLYTKALHMHDDGKDEQALEFFIKSQDLASKYQFKEYYENSKNYIMSLKSSIAEEHYKKGFEHFRKNHFDSAAAEYREALRFSPDHAAAKMELDRISRTLGQQYYEQGMGYYTRSELEKAKDMFKKALSYDPDKLDAQRALERIK